MNVIKSEARNHPYHRRRGGGPESGLQVVHSQDNGPVGSVEHCGQKKWAHEQPHGPLQSLPPTIAPRATTVMLGGLQKTGRSRALASDPQQTADATARSKDSRSGQRMFCSTLRRQAACFPATPPGLRGVRV